MEYIRFASSQRYGTRVPLRQLAFKVTVSRAFLIESESPEVLCEVTVPWNAKLPSPLERLTTYKQLEAALSASKPASVSTKMQTTGEGGGAAGEDGTDRIGRTPEGTAALAAARLSGALPAVEQIVTELQTPSAQLFTRPPMEDFIDVTEEGFPVEPPMGPSLLAPIVLRQHRREHQPNNRMYFMWALGKLTGAPKGAGPVDREQRQGLPEGHGEETPETLSTAALDWSGEERVLCTITAERDEYFFTAKPSLNTPHTVLVDAVYIYSFVIRAVDVASDRGGAGGQEEASMDVPASRTETDRRGRRELPSKDPSGANAAGPTAANAASARLAAQQASDTIRAISAQATEAYHHLARAEGVEGDAAARATAQRLLRDAAMTLPDIRPDASPQSAPDLVSSTTAATRGAVAPGESTGAFPNDWSTATGSDGRRGSVAVLPSLPAGGSGLDKDTCRYYIYGVVERCLGLPYDTVFLKCMLVRETGPDASTGAARDVPTFFLEQEALAQATGTSSGPSPPEALFSSQLAYAGAVTVEDYLVETDHTFNMPFEYSYVDERRPRSPLRLMVAALSEGFSGDGCQTPVGYCSVSLPVISPGTHKVQCPMWLPHKTGKEFVKSTVVGGGPSLVDVRETGPALRGRTGISVKQGLLADSGGLLCLTINVVQQENVA